MASNRYFLICAGDGKLEAPKSCIFALICACDGKLRPIYLHSLRQTQQKKVVFTPMQNVIFPLFYKDFSKSNLTENTPKCLFARMLANLTGFKCMDLYVSLFGFAPLNLRLIFCIYPYGKVTKRKQNNVKSRKIK